jgi:hypothetical protein
MLGGSRVVAPDGRTVAAAPRHSDLVTAPELLVVDIAVDNELAAAAAAAGMLWSAAARTPALSSPLPARTTEEDS